MEQVWTKNWLPFLMTAVVVDPMQVYPDEYVVVEAVELAPEEALVERRYPAIAETPMTAPTRRKVSTRAKAILRKKHLLSYSVLSKRLHA